MPLNSVSLYTKSVLTGLVIPSPIDGSFAIPNPEVWIAPPVYGDFEEAPQIYVWSGKITLKQETMAGQSGATINTTGPFHVNTYELGIFIKYMLPNDLVQQDSVFPLIVDRIVEKLQSVVLPVAIVDATVNARPSSITHFGKDMDIWYGNIHEAEDGRWWVYEAEIRNTIRESVQQ